MKIKYILFLLSIIILPALLSPNTAQGAVTCTVTSSKATVDPGESFDLTVNFSDGKKHSFVYQFNNGIDSGNTINPTSNPYTFTVKALSKPFSGITIHQPPRSQAYSCNAQVASTTPPITTDPVAYGPAGLAQKTCELDYVGHGILNSDPTQRVISMHIINKTPDDINVRIIAKYQSSDKYQLTETIKISGIKSSYNIVKNADGTTRGANAQYFMPVNDKAPGGTYAVQVFWTAYNAPCDGSATAKLVDVADIPNTDKGIKSTLTDIENPTPFGSLGNIFTALIPNIFAIAGMLAFAFLVFGGIRYALARGDMKATDAARGVITNAITGLVIILTVFIVFELITAVFGFTLFSLAPAVSAQTTVDIGCAVKLGEKCIKNAFPSFASLITAIIAAATALMGLIFFALLVFGGIRYMLAHGDEKATQAARGVLTSAVIGLLIVLGAFAIITLIGLVTGIDLLP